MRCINCPFYVGNGEQNYCSLLLCISASGKCIAFPILKERILLRRLKFKWWISTKMQKIYKGFVHIWK